ncbi:MAG: 4Fe-4S binding protein [Desulfobacterales bacterium]|jgi:Fe-S-cluster-containing dehydrogenase component|nr:4Fe-4S binding protein [Desulfobacterales bacterium]
MKYQVSHSQENCTGCLCCQLACSRIYEKRFQPTAARIWIQLQRVHYTADFSQECIACGLCADACLFGALTKHPMEAAS